MNYIQQINGYWIAQRIHALSYAETGLYFYLLNICNTLRWKNPFHRNNASIMGDMGIKSRHTLHRHLQRLKEAGIIEYTTVAGNPNVTCTLCDLSIFCSGDATGSATGNATGGATGNATGGATDNINKTKTKINQTSEDKSSGGGQKIFPKSEKEEKEKNCPAAKKEKEATPHWRLLVDEWFGFYHAHTGTAPTFEGQAQACLKKICRRLQARSQEAGYEWTAEAACGTLRHFLQRACESEWLSNNLLLPNLERQYDKIVNQNDNTYGHKRQQQGNGSCGDIQSVFAAIDAMPD